MRWSAILLFVYLSALSYSNDKKKTPVFYDTPEELSLAVLDALRKDGKENMLAVIPSEIELQRIFNTEGKKSEKALQDQLDLLKKARDFRKNDKIIIETMKMGMNKDKFTDDEFVGDKEKIKKKPFWQQIFYKKVKLIRVIKVNKEVYEKVSVSLFIDDLKVIIISGCYQIDNKWVFLGSVSLLYY